MKYWYSLIFILTNLLSAFADSGKLVGYVYSTDGKPIEFTNISLTNTTDSTYIAGTYTNEIGKFMIDIPRGCYAIKYSCIGYAPRVDSVCITDNFSVDTVHLCTEPAMLKEVVVGAKRPTVKRNATGIIVSVENSKYLQNKTLDKILTLSPGVFMDDDGNISINGNGGVTVVFNDRTIRLGGEQLISYLKSIQGMDLKNIEIMSNPSAAYDAEGTGGIIKINTHHKRNIGLTGFIAGEFTYDRKFSYKPSFGLAYSLGNITLYGNYNYYRNKDIMDRYTEDNYSNGQQHLLSETYSGSGRSQNYTVGVDWTINGEHYIGIEYNGMMKKSTDKGVLTTMSYSNNSYNGLIDGLNESIYNRNNNMFNLNYIWRIDTIGQMLKFTADYTDITGRDDIDDYFNQYFDSKDMLTDILYKRQISKEKAYIYSAKIDYETIWNHGIWKFSTGMKFSAIKNRYSYNLLSWKNEQDIPQEDPLFKDNFKYTENICAGYLTAYFNKEQFEANAGIRSEYERTEGTSLISGKNNIQIDFHIFPSIFLYWKPCKTSGFMAYYGMRIRRPSYQLLNPFIYYLSEFSLKTGNPDLNPEIVNSIELTYVLYNKYYMSLRTEFRKNRISDISYTNGQYTTISTTNLSSYSKYYFNTYIPLNWGIWNCDIMANVGLLDTEAYGRNKKTLDMNVNWNNIFHFSDNLIAQCQLYYAPPYKDVYLYSDRHKIKLDIKFDYSFYKDKWLLTLGCDDILDSTRKNSFWGNYTDLTQKTVTYGISPGRTFYVGLKFNFSADEKIKKRNKDTSISDELNRL